MKTLMIVLVSLIAIIAAQKAHASTHVSTSAKKSTAAEVSGEKANVGTDFKFDDLTVHGQYQSANEGLVTVENDKELKNLLDYRTDYKDRLKSSRLNP
jgi:maltose-binding protein MalE